MYTSCALLQHVAAFAQAGALQILFEQETFRIVVRFMHRHRAALLVDNYAWHRFPGAGMAQRFTPHLFHAGGDVAVALLRGDAGLVPFQCCAAAEQQQSRDQNRGKCLWAQHIKLE